MFKTISTVGIVVLRGKQVLLITKDNHPKHLYQLPGGQIEAGETEVEAACRELNETTGIESKIENFIKIPTEWQAVIKKDYGEASFIFKCFICRDYTGDIRRTKSATPEWTDLSELDSLVLNPNTQNAINAAMKL